MQGSHAGGQVRLRPDDFLERDAMQPFDKDEQTVIGELDDFVDISGGAHAKQVYRLADCRCAGLAGRRHRSLFLPPANRRSDSTRPAGRPVRGRMALGKSTVSRTGRIGSSETSAGGLAFMSALLSLSLSLSIPISILYLLTSETLSLRGDSPRETFIIPSKRGGDRQGPPRGAEEGESGSIFANAQEAHGI